MLCNDMKLPWSYNNKMIKTKNEIYFNYINWNYI